MSTSLDNFRATQLGHELRPIIEDGENVRDMIVLSKHGIPAVQVIGKQVAALGKPAKAGLAKQMIGKWVRDVLEREGWTPIGKGRVAPGNHFSTGAIYGRRQA